MVSVESKREFIELDVVGCRRHFTVVPGGRGDAAGHSGVPVGRGGGAPSTQPAARGRSAVHRRRRRRQVGRTQADRRGDARRQVPGTLVEDVDAA